MKAYQAKMTKTASKIRFKAMLFRPPATAKVSSWTLLTLPKKASAKLPSRGMTMVEGTINGVPFPRAALEPDCLGSHSLRVNRTMREAAGADAGDVVTMEIATSKAASNQGSKVASRYFVVTSSSLLALKTILPVKIQIIKADTSTVPPPKGGYGPTTP